MPLIIVIVALILILGGIGECNDNTKRLKELEEERVGKLERELQELRLDLARKQARP